MLALGSKILQRSVLVRLVIAGIAVVVAIAAFVVLRPSGDVADLSSPLTLLAPRDGGIVSSRHFRFRWSKQSQSKAYQFLLYEVNRSLLWSALVRDTLLVIPTSVSLQQGQTYLWRVEAIMPDETTIHSELQAFTFSE